MKFNPETRVFILICSIFNIQNTNSVEILRPRGVSVSRASLYNPDKDFTCLDGTLTIPFNYVNDDYCDCSDGSDEPGTSACPNGTFHCTNAGHRPLDIPSSRINDGICDCCDASDEFNGQEKRKGGMCRNICLELGRAAREEAQRVAELQRQGFELKKEMARKGREMQSERSEKLTQLRKDKEEAEALKNEKETVKKLSEDRENAVLAKYREAEEAERNKKLEEEKLAERQKALKAFDELDTDRNQRISLAEIKANQAFDQNRNGEVSDDEAKFFLMDNEEVSEESFWTDCWQRMKPFYLMPSGLYNTESTNEENASDAITDELTTQPEDETEDYTDHEEDGHEDERDDEAEDVGQEAPSTVENEKASSIEYDEETQQLIDEATKARQEFDDADRALRDVERDVRSLEEALEKDYGLDNEFSPLDGECFEYSDREYIYKLCPFDQATQRPKAGGSETRLGTWGHWAGTDNYNKYSKMMYDRGQACWNGPQRSTLVEISCGTENELISVSEPNRCEYKYEFRTPAACHSPDSVSSGHDRHDEL